MLKLHLKDQDDTSRLGKILARLLRPGDVVLFMGDLGAGKTFLIREIAKYLRIDTRLVTSPTFSIFHTYEHPKITIVHADLYRLGKDADLDEIGLIEHILEKKGCGLIEWGDFLAAEDKEGLHILEIKLYFPTQTNVTEYERHVEISTNNDNWRKRLEQFIKLAHQEGITCESASS